MVRLIGYCVVASLWIVIVVGLCDLLVGWVRPTAEQLHDQEKIDSMVAGGLIKRL